MILKNKKIVTLLCLALIAGISSFLLPTCASEKSVTAKDPVSFADDAKTSVFYGAYGDDLQFKAIAVAEQDGKRVVIMSDLGVKLQDMKIKNDGKTDIYFSIAYMPKETSDVFSSFFKDYFSETATAKVKLLNNRVYYFENETPVLWVRKI